VTFDDPQGTYLAWLDFSAFGLDNPARHLRDRARVALTDGGPFRGGSDSHARLNFATQPEVLIESIGRIEQYLKSL
jgi:cystathionine beta-lyase